MRHDIKKIARALKIKFNTNNPYDLASSLKIEIIERPLGNTYGMYKYIKKTRVILLNSSLNETLKRVVLAHELGHAILHPTVNCYFMRHKTLYVTNKFENEANKFAAELLIDEKEIKNLCLQNMSIEQLACYFLVPKELISLKLNNFF